MSAGRTIIIGGDAAFVTEMGRSLGAQGSLALPADAAASQIAASAKDQTGSLAFVFAPSPHNEIAEIADALAAEHHDIADVLSRRLKSFAAQLQSAVNSLLARGGGQLWVCDYDDTFAYHMATPASPILAQARASAIRSVAKEYARMGVVANTLVIQPTREMTGGPAAERERRDLRVYASRFKAQAMAHVTDYLAVLIHMKPLPFTGTILGAGTSVDQSHLIL
jgi:hypothetical protein